MPAFASYLWQIILAITRTYIPGVSNMIRSSPILLFTVGIFALGGAIGILGRLLSRD